MQRVEITGDNEAEDGKDKLKKGKRNSKISLHVFFVTECSCTKCLQ